MREPNFLKMICFFASQIKKPKDKIVALCAHRLHNIFYDHDFNMKALIPEKCTRSLLLNECENVQIRIKYL